MTRICITGSTDGIGLEAARLLAADGHEIVVHARSDERGRPVADELGARLVTGDLADLDRLPPLADAIGEIDVLVHNAGVWTRSGPTHSAQGHELTFAVNALAPHVLTSLLGDRVRERLVFLGSGTISSGHVDPASLGSGEGGGAYADSKAIDVALALGWARRRPDLLVGAVDPGWVKTKLATTGAPGEARSGGERVAYAAASPDWSGGYTAGRRAARVPSVLESTTLQDELMTALDALAP